MFLRELLESLGDADTIEAQSKAILMENDIQDKEFSDEVRRKSTFECLKYRWSILFCYQGDQMFTISSGTLEDTR